MGEQVEVLEHHAHFLAVQVDIHLFYLAVFVDKLLLGDVDIMEKDLTVGGDLQQIQAAKQELDKNNADLVRLVEAGERIDEDFFCS